MDNTNALLPNLALDPRQFYTLDCTYYSNDRLSPSYFKRHITRLRDAFERWGHAPVR